MLNIRFGKTKSSVKDLMIVSAILAIVVGGIAQFTNMPEEKVWCALDQLTRHLNISILEETKLKIIEIVKCRAQKAVDKGIDDYKNNYEIITGKKWKPVEITPPLYSEMDIDSKVCYTDDCTALGGEMRLCSQWVDGCEGVPVEFESLKNPEIGLDKPQDTMLKFFKF